MATFLLALWTVWSMRTCYRTKEKEKETRAVLVAKQRVGLPSEPLFRGSVPLAWYQKKGPVILYISCSTTVQKFLTVLEISVQISFRGRTCRSLKGPHRKKMKGAYCLELHSEQLLFYNAFKNICRFRGMTAQKFIVLAP